MVALGRVVGPFGVRGWMKVAADAQAQESLVAAPAWWIANGASWKCVVVEATRTHGAGLIAKLEGVDVPEALRPWKGSPIGIPYEQLPKLQEGQYYWDSLIGLDVTGQEERRLGWIHRVFFNGSHDVIEVRNGRTRLIPWVPSVVVEVDIDGGRVRVDWAADW